MNMNKKIAEAMLSTLASAAVVGFAAIVDKAVKNADDAKYRSRNGYKKVHVSALIAGIKPGEFCVTGNEMVIGIMPEDMRTTVSATSFVIDASVPYASEETPGWYYTRINGVTRISFFDGENILLIPEAKSYISTKKELNVGTDLVRADVEELMDEVKALKRNAMAVNERLMKAEKAAAHKAAMKAKKPEKPEKSNKKEYDETKGVDDEDLV